MKTNKLIELLDVEAKHYEERLLEAGNQATVIVAGTLSALFCSLSRVVKGLQKPEITTPVDFKKHEN